MKPKLRASSGLNRKTEVAVDNATAQALETVQKWASRSDKKAQLNGRGYAHNTYKAICLRDGIFQNYQGLSDWNQALYVRTCTVGSVSNPSILTSLQC